MKKSSRIPLPFPNENDTLTQLVVASGNPVLLMHLLMAEIVIQFRIWQLRRGLP